MATVALQFIFFSKVTFHCNIETDVVVLNVVADNEIILKG